MKIDYSRAFAPPELLSRRDEGIVWGVKALAEGKCTDPGQQMAVVNFIIADLCRTYDLSFRPDDVGGARDSDFAEGRRFVGLQLRRIITEPHDNLLIKRK